MAWMQETEFDPVKVDMGILRILNIGIINSRKLSIRSLIVFACADADDGRVMKRSAYAMENEEDGMRYAMESIEGIAACDGKKRYLPF